MKIVIGCHLKALTHPGLASYFQQYFQSLSNPDTEESKTPHSHYLPPKFSPASNGTSFLASCPGGTGCGRRGCPAALAALNSCCNAFMSQLAPLKILNISGLFASSLQNVSLLLFLSFKCHTACLAESTQSVTISLHWG